MNKEFHIPYRFCFAKETIRIYAILTPASDYLTMHNSFDIADFHNTVEDAISAEVEHTDPFTLYSTNAALAWLEHALEGVAILTRCSINKVKEITI